VTPGPLVQAFLVSGSGAVTSLRQPPRGVAWGRWEVVAGLQRAEGGGHEGVEEAVAATAAVDENIGRDAEVLLGDDLEELDLTVGLGAEGLDSSAVGFGLGLAGGAVGVGFAIGPEDSSPVGQGFRLK